MRARKGRPQGAPHSRPRRRAAGVCAGAVVAGLLLGTLVVPWGDEAGNDDARNAAPGPVATPSAPSPPPTPPKPTPPDPPSPPAVPSPPGDTPPPGSGRTAIGAFLDSGPRGVRRIAELERWLGGTELRVGHTYLPGDLWVNIEGRPEFLRPWARWRRADADRMLVLNVPMFERNEAGVGDAEVRRLLRTAARGDFDHHFRTLAERLVRLGAEDTVLVLGWEMNGTTYTHRCAPDPHAWKAYWRRIVTTMRAVPGQEFRFDFTPSRGRDAVPWPRCYPGDDVVDIIGLDAYDQPPGADFTDHVTQPYGLQHHVDFAAARGKPISFPEWGLFRNGDNPAYMRGMLEWFDRHRPVYQTVTDYCPHGVWQCRSNPRSSAVFREALYGLPDVSAPSGTPEPSATARPDEVAGRPEEPGCVALEFGDWLERWIGERRVCLFPDRPGTTLTFGRDGR
ncbi:glycosyl hydrolase family 26 [Streptomyces chumphonensis]|uniref:Glycosyl hydrolase family 26 n=1 Tax=Streptomyces chumphonensis TaxID=1214925 RepID=A0A927EYV1_9ACTN|nr:glycosyl hydrolase [Streptomyces chumphonensis]MBD3931527.1 glycosyl hydrolase family 26 [Streptomyces chumphonensis]